MNSLPKTVTRQRRDCDLNPGASAPESSAIALGCAKCPAIKQSSADHSLYSMVKRAQRHVSDAQHRPDSRMRSRKNATPFFSNNLVRNKPNLINYSA